jgi:hypothetical protein
MRAVVLIALCFCAASAEVETAEWMAPDAAPEEEIRQLTTDTGSAGSYGSGSYGSDSYGGDEEVAPTPYPTISPTPRTNPPLPAYDPNAFATILADFTDLIDASAIGGATLTPTPAPTAYPTYPGYEMVAKTITTTKISTPPMTFALSVAAVNEPVMKAVLRQGAADALGFDADAVTIEKVAHTSRRLNEGRQLTAPSADITFGIRSNTADTAQVTQLKDNIVDVAGSGAFVDNIKVAAGNAGILTHSLANMDNKITVSKAAMTTASVQYEVYEPVFTATPGPAPASDDDDKLPIILGAVFGGLAVLLICVFIMTRSSSAKAASPTLTPKGGGGEPVTNV